MNPPLKQFALKCRARLGFGRLRASVGLDNDGNSSEMINLPDFVNEGEQGNKNEQEGLSTPTLCPPQPGNLQVPFLAQP